MARTASIERITNETQIKLHLSVDGSGVAKIGTGIAFLDHMLDAFARHGLFDLNVEAVGDIGVDFHHTVEDIGIVLGSAFKEALQGKEGQQRYGHAMVPMDQTLVSAIIDLSGRPCLVYNLKLPPMTMIGNFDVGLAHEFLQAFANNAGATVHIKHHYGDNAHHVIEACFKAFARALDEATTLDARILGVMSTKGSL